MKNICALLVCTVAAASSVVAQDQGRVRPAKKPIRSQYIVVLQTEVDPDGVGNESAARFNGRLRHVYRSALRGFAVTLPPQAAAALAEDPRVRFIEEDAVVEAQQLQANPPWGLDRLDQRLLPLDQTYVYGAPQAQQVTVHVLDTGVRTSHFEFAGRAFVAGDYIDDDQDGDPSDIGNDDGDPSRMDGQDCHGHGTHVAGTIGGLNVGVAKHVVLQSHRVLGCNGSGSLSGLIAAIDAVVESPARPAVANMSLGAGASSALDSAVRTAIASGITFVVAAGNDNVDAAMTSPARVAEAITVGATSSNDARASFSNFGAALDLFAPGVSITSAARSSDTATTSMSGTSMASPHVAGVAAAYLERNPAATPAQVRDALVAAATSGRVTNAGAGSPNLLLYSGFLHASSVAIELVSPNGGEQLMSSSPYTIRWNVTSGGSDVTRFDVHVSSNNGSSYAPISGCSSLPATARTCTWSSPGPAASAARVKVVATDSAGQPVSDASAGSFSIVAGTGTITVTAPNTVVNWGRGSTQVVTWSHNLGAESYVRLELSRDGGLTFPEVIAAAVKNTTYKSGVYYWPVTGPLTQQAVIRVSWTNGSASDVSNVGFTIAEPFITATAPAKSGTNWGYGSVQAATWTSNLGPLDKVTVLLSVDGTTYTAQASNIEALDRLAYIQVPTLPAATATARVRVAWSNAPAGVNVAGTNPVAFKIEPPFVIVGTPNGGDIWTVGTTQTVRWGSNMTKADAVDIQLSKDGGATWTTLRGATANDNAESFLVDSSWLTGSGRIRIVLSGKPMVFDASDANFTVR